MHECIRCGEPIKQGNSYHTKRVGDVDVHLHAYDCVKKGSQRLDKDVLFTNGAVACDCGEPLITENTPAVAPMSTGICSCQGCSRIYQISDVAACRKPGRVTVVGREDPVIGKLPRVGRITMVSSLDCF